MELLYVLYTLIVTCLWMIQKVIISPKKSNYLFILWVYETVLYRGLKEYVPLSFKGNFHHKLVTCQDKDDVKLYILFVFLSILQFKSFA